MRSTSTGMGFSAWDLSWFLACHHKTASDALVAQKRLAAPGWHDPTLDLLRERGLDHERRYTDSLRAQGLVVVDLTDQPADATGDAIRSGADVLVQATLADGPWLGRPDVLRRVGTGRYEVVDTKLARETSGAAILQLSLYSDLLGTLQGSAPERFHVVTPHPVEPMRTFRVDDFAAYYRHARARFEHALAGDPGEMRAATYPDPVEACGMCPWWQVCDRRRRDDDHLSLVASISRLQRRELDASGVHTLTALAGLPLPFRPRRGAADTYARIREQARVQWEGRTTDALVHELLPVVEGHGLARLPEPSPGDVFLDLEGDPFVREGGREYLFGWVVDGTYHARWARTDAEERAAFEDVVDAIGASWQRHPGMHVYHYAPYEPSAFKRLMGRHASREGEMDRLLRAERFVDLYGVVRQGVRASVERYSIKDLEPFYGYVRDVDLAVAGGHRRLVERALAHDAPIATDSRAAVQGYNRDDCVSAWRLRDWLEGLRREAVEGGAVIPRPIAQEGEPTEALTERARRSRERALALLEGVPDEPSERDDDDRARWLLAHLLEWHRREDKAPWWEFYRLRDLPEEDLFDEKAAIAGLTVVARIASTRAPVDRYAWPPQDTEVDVDDVLHLPDGETFGDVVAIDRIARTVDVKKRMAYADLHPVAAFEHNVIPTTVLAESLARIAEDVIARGLDGTRYAAAGGLLTGSPPRLLSGRFGARDGEQAADFARRIADDLDRTVLPIQGPPGAGKTHTGARMIVDLVRRGRRVGVTATSHKVIRNLLEAVERIAGEEGLPVACAHKVRTRSPWPGRISETTDNAELLGWLQDGRVQVAGATAWTWATPDAETSVDVLFVDEAGQMSLANVLAASPCADSVVLLGDPQQLEQPRKGSHPEGTDLSALDHVLGGHATLPEGRGVFLPETWRLAPALCAFTSEVFYEGRLRARPGLDRQVVAGTGRFDGAGFHVVEVPHDGNQSASDEEAAEVARILASLVRGTWTDQRGHTHPIGLSDVLVVAPYNAQVARIAEHLPPGTRVGTVDKFQGQEAPVVIYSMATSRPEDAPRGMEFLYSPNRLNVATSRARCVCILVASPRLFEPECRSPRQMQLANAFCRYREVAEQRLGGTS